jgi:hypothetical protein
MSIQDPNIGVDKLSTVLEEQLVRVERVDDSEYVVAHSDDMALVFGGLVSDEGMESCQVMIDGQAARFDPDTLEMEFVRA